MPVDFSGAQLGLLAGLVFLAGVVDSLAGGGGLITLPAYLAMGLDPALVLGTNKLASSIGLTVSVSRYLRKIPLSPKSFAPVVLCGLVCAAIGARLVLLIDPSHIHFLLLIALPAVAYTVLSKHSFGIEDKSSSLSPGERGARSLAVAGTVGCYDGFFGPGAGVFFAVGFSKFCRFDLLRATSAAKLLNFTSNIAALSTFLFVDRVHIELGLAMGVMSVAGHYVGSSLGLKKGAAVIRPMLILVSGALFVKILVDVLSGG